MDPKVKDFLSGIGQVESASGKYTNHKTLEHGMHKGSSAYGTYGLMPLTIAELVGSSKNPDVQSLQGLPDEELKAMLASNPALEQALASQLAEKVLANQHGDQQKAAYAWYNGHNLSPEKIESRDYINSDYVKKFSKASNLISSNTPASPITVEGTPAEAQVLGYLGAGGGGGTAATLALNASQRSDIEKLMDGLGRSPATTATPDLGYGSLITKLSPEALEPEVPAPVVRQNVQPVPTTMPNFGSINKLIASYNKGKK